MEAEYAERYAELNRRHWWWRAREGYLLRLLTALRPPDGKARILDVGCGDGQLLDRLLPWGTAEGLESDRTTLTHASARRKIHVGPFDETFGTVGSFDFVLFLDVLEHLPEPVTALRRARALLAPGGKVVLSVPAFPSLWTSHDDMNHHHLRLTKRSLRAWADAAGLEVASARYLFWTVALGKVLQVQLERFRTPATTVPAIPPAPVNALAHLIAHLDLRVAGLVPMPFGSSLVAVLGPDTRPGLN
jgi:2-polyprenyl-3-methyl-5-hydroxy-6-metoxy-1,4-benzoquinol methylase